MKNRHGLDSDYIGKNLQLLQRDIGNYRPDEMRRALMRLADTCEPENTCPTCEGLNTCWHGDDHNWCKDCNAAYSRVLTPTLRSE